MTTTPAPKGADIEQYRAGFEAWARKRTFSLQLDEEGHYLFSDTFAAWAAWRAAKRESVSGSSTSTSQGAPGKVDENKLGILVAWYRDGKLPADLVWNVQVTAEVLRRALGSVSAGAAPGDALGAAPDLYECIGKGERYKLLGDACGAGTMRGAWVVVYRDTASGEYYYRSMMDFSERMRKLEGSAIAASTTQQEKKS